MIGIQTIRLELWRRLSFDSNIMKTYLGCKKWNKVLNLFDNIKKYNKSFKLENISKDFELKLQWYTAAIYSCYQIGNEDMAMELLNEMESIISSHSNIINNIEINSNNDENIFLIKSDFAQILRGKENHDSSLPWEIKLSCIENLEENNGYYFP